MRQVAPLLAGAAIAFASAGASQAASSPEQRLQRVEALVEEQARRLAEQERLIRAQQDELIALRSDRTVESIRAGRAQADAIDRPQRTLIQEPVPNVVSEGVPARPVGEAPASEPAANVAALPDRVGVLTPRGQLIFDPSIEYVRSSANRLVFRGVEIVTGIQLGVIEANDADRGSGVATVAARYGLTNRLEVEARLPYVERSDRVTTVAQAQETNTRTMSLKGNDIGDAEFAARYQLTSGRAGRPVFVASGRVKTPTGKGPYEVNYDQDGVARELATGSGFWAAEGGVTMLYPSDPAVIFAGLTYLHNFSSNINRTFGDVRVGRVDPGDSIGASVGFGFALNPRFSFSLGYSHSYILPTKTELGATTQKSNSLQVGSILMGWSYRLSDRLSLNNNFEFGVTSDAPDVRIVVRAPFRF
jgi:hypothetical protein